MDELKHVEVETENPPAEWLGDDPAPPADEPEKPTGGTPLPEVPASYQRELSDHEIFRRRIPRQWLGR